MTPITTECAMTCGSKFETHGMTHREVRGVLKGAGWLPLNGVWYCPRCKATVRPVPRDV